ncbi:hypothetical protein T05_9385 [Trichinella murrelli]|uniref:Uncharacterized protein n=1 Tax=Trichinella murrelli TaxID=144512 RepID=A0A0V0T8E6_9BILA|nr:hypothetical protein T05_9385 [Trichinella murrelli]
MNNRGDYGRAQSKNQFLCLHDTRTCLICCQGWAIYTHNVLNAVSLQRCFWHVTTITAEFLKNNITNVTQIKDQFIELDADDMRSSKARQDFQMYKSMKFNMRENVRGYS